MQQRRILWLALAFSTVIYAVIVYTTSIAQAGGSFDDAIRKPFVLPLYAAALGLFFAGLLGFASIKEREPNLGMILRLALFESTAIMGLLAAFLNQDWRLYLPAWALALIGFVREWPSE